MSDKKLYRVSDEYQKHLDECGSSVLKRLDGRLVVATEQDIFEWMEQHKNEDFTHILLKLGWVKAECLHELRAMSHHLFVLCYNLEIWQPRTQQQLVDESSALDTAIKDLLGSGKQVVGSPVKSEPQAISDKEPAQKTIKVVGKHKQHMSYSAIMKAKVVEK